jgi:hypothetical protein
VYIQCSKGFHHGISSVNLLYFKQITPSITLPYLFSSIPIIQQISVCFVTPFSYTDAMYFDIIHSLPFSFPFPLPLMPLRQSYYCKHSIHTHIWSCLYLGTSLFPFWIQGCLPHMRENILSLSFWMWLNMIT